MFSIIRSFVIISTVALIATGSTYSFFSATDTISGNTISTATLSFDAFGEANATTLAKPLSATNLFPGGYSPWARAALQNNSTFPVKYHMYVDNLSGSICHLINLKITTGEAGSDASERTRTVFDDNLLDIAGAAKAIALTSTPPFTEAPANGGKQIIQQRAQLDESAGNGEQDKDCTWNEIFVAESTVPDNG